MTMFFYSFLSEDIKRKKPDVISERDFILLWNLLPKKYEEAVALVPSLEDTPKDVVQKIITLLNEKAGNMMGGADMNDQ